MRISVVQTRPVPGNVQANIDKHKKLIDLGISNNSGVIVFPELSLTGYEPKLASSLATNQDDTRLKVFQAASDTHGVVICVGIPVRSEAGIMIGMVIFQPGRSAQTYCKQLLHSDELPYFVEGQRDVMISAGNHKIAPAICYESLVPEHAERAFRDGASIYLASVAKSARGIEKARAHFPEIARKYSMTVLMSNCVGPCDDFISFGQSSIWNDQGMSVATMDEKTEGILIWDTDKREAKAVRLAT